MSQSVPLKRGQGAVARKKDKKPLLLPDAEEQVPSDAPSSATAAKSGETNTSQGQTQTIAAVQARASGMTTYDLLSNKDALMAGFNLLTQLTTKKLNADQIGERLGLQESRRAREVSPDISAGPSKGKQKKRTSEDNTQEMKEHRLRPRKLKIAILKDPKLKSGSNNEKEGKPRRDGLRPSKKAISKENVPSKDLMDSVPSGSNKNIDNGNVEVDGTTAAGILNKNEEEDSDEFKQKAGEALFRELVSRSDNTQLNCDPKDVDLDAMLNQTCSLTGIVPQYEEKSEMFKIHSKKITDLSIKKLTKNFKKISPQITAIFKGTIISERQQLYMAEGLLKRRELKEMNVSVPFDNDQGTALFSLLYDLVVPDPLDRPKYADYINYVLLPESFIRIYSCVNDISYETASTEMRFGACYDGPLLQ